MEESRFFAFGSGSFVLLKLVVGVCAGVEWSGVGIGFDVLFCYRAGLNLTALTKNDKAECLADEIAEQFKDQPCTNTTGSNTVPGTESQFSNYPSLLAKCHLNVTTTRDGMIMPACVPNLVPSLVLSNFTESQYSLYLNDTKYTSAGIGSEKNWIVAVLTTNTPEGSYTPGDSASPGFKLVLNYHTLFLLTGFFLLL
ncbi:hypothetical protein RJ639_018728 [Escallonia herrerae]|uniref:Uncharacterized GPI-anchored protein At5g19230-like domain-containing protein n=1 Tax=Escallonia herrerae TaxID=1293975 RepID=A0AA88V9V4_9ASTE|nr:hypothetical protein RJ639_018728 [Escallonia herrerae]